MIPSFGLIDAKNLDELNFLIKIIKIYFKEKYNKNSVLFEHGMCACVGGLDRAHMHIMSLNNNTSKISLTNSINKVLFKRKIGIEYIKFGKYKLENVHDINQFMDDKSISDKQDYEVKGNVLDLRDLKNLDFNKWPIITLNHIKKGGHYVYFKSDYSKCSFLTTLNFQTQFGREVVYENEIALSEKFKSQIDKISNENPLLEVWKWQNVMFEDNIIQTVNTARYNLKKYVSKFLSEYKEFNIRVL